MSPGFIDLSSRMMMPLTKFDTTFCRPMPMPTPSAPEKTVSAVRSMPSAASADAEREDQAARSSASLPIRP